MPSDSPAASRSPPPGTTRRRAEPPAGPPTPTHRSRLPIPTDPPAPTLVRRPDRWRKQASAPEPLVGPRPTLDRRWAPRGPRHGVPDMPAVRLAARFRPGAAAGHSPGHRLRRSVPPADTRQWLAGQRTWRTSRASGRPDTPVQCDRLADGYGPGPDGGGQAADTSSAQRPTMRLASRPRPARSGPDRTGRQCACSLRPTPAATSIRTRPS